jgi:medium-chain acyl-[acyl-carrier-protein] hydrolase
MEKVKLFCLPYAGGSATVYNKWKILLDDGINLQPIEPAGRGKRYNEPFYSDVNEAINDITQIIYKRIKDSPYAIFGHSMGCLLAYEVACRLKEMGCRDPEHVFFSGRCPPHLVKIGTKLHLLPDDQFKECILQIGGTSKEVFETQELCNIFIPVLKADYRIVEEYIYVSRDYRLACPITVLNGSEDDATPFSKMLEWKSYSYKDCSNYQFDGGHFFIHTQMERVIELINKSLLGE